VCVWKRGKVETRAQILYIMGTGTVVIVFNNFGVKLGFGNEN
jgi:hypothetical protein